MERTTGPVAPYSAWPAGHHNPTHFARDDFARSVTSGWRTETAVAVGLFHQAVLHGSPYRVELANKPLQLLLGSATNGPVVFSHAPCGRAQRSNVGC